MITRHLVVLAPNFAYTYPVEMLNHIQSHCRPAQGIEHHATSTLTPEVTESRILSMLGRRKPMALIGISLRPTATAVARYQEAETPIVLIDETTDGTSTVAVDNYQGGLIAGQHLVKMGRRNIAIVCGETGTATSFNAVARLKGLRAALSAAGLPLPATHVVEVHYYSYPEGRQALKTWHDQKLKIDAVFCAAGDDCATGLLRAAQELGIGVPSDLAVIGFDDIEAAQSTLPPLTTVRQPLDKIAKAAYELASDGDNDIAQHPRKVVFDPQLIVRQSA